MTLPATFVADAIDAYVEAHESVHEWDGLWHPSSISGCTRKALYEMRQVEQTDAKSSRQRRILFLGSRFHEIAQAAVAASDPLVVEVYTEVRVLIPDLQITGAADQLVLLIYEDGHAELMEFKTIKEWGFKAVVKANAPKDDHLEQTKSYLLALRLHGGVADDGRVVPPLGDRLTRVRFTYIEKQTFDTHEIVVEWDPAWEAEVRERIGELETYRANPESLPPRLPMNGSKKDYRCDWGWGRCGYFTRCWEQDPAEVGIDF